MKTKIVLWGERGENEKVLLALELKEKENKVLLYIFPLEVATEDFYQSMLDQWREDKPLEMPKHELIEKPLSVTEGLLPDDIKVERTDVISRAQAEWHFVVLSSKLYDLYKGELDELKEKLEKVSKYEDSLWDEAKGFWSKVQAQVNEKNLFREHATILKDRTNNIFEKLKTLRKEVQKEFEAKSAEVSASFHEEIAEIQNKIDKGLGLKPMFEELKKLQDRFYKTDFSKDDRKSVWDKLDATFKSLKDKKFGDSPKFGENGGSGGSRLQSRYDGLLSAIQKMENSIKKDREEIDFQGKKISQSDGQLETQIRQAKLIMIEERINSKDEKLQDMYKTRSELESKMAAEKNREAQMQKNAKKEEVKEAIKQKIADEIKTAEEERSETAEHLENVASEINDSKSKNKENKTSILSAISDAVELAIDNVSEAIEDVVDNVKAVAEVVEDRIEDAIEKMQEKKEEVASGGGFETPDTEADQKSDKKEA